jgi:segregation and condensation protein A
MVPETTTAAGHTAAAGHDAATAGHDAATAGRDSTRAAPKTTSGAAISFAEHRRPEAGTRVDLGEWEGPLGLLLTLIEARQLDILTVPLGALADAYLEALATLEGDRLAHVSAFVAVASQLILIKSRAILPRRIDSAVATVDEGPDPEAELRARLLLYRAYRDAGARLAAGAVERVGLFAREPSLAHATAMAHARPADGPPLDPRVLSRSLDGLARLVPPAPPPPEVVPRTITLTERAAILRAALRDADSVVLQDLLRGVRDRVLVAVTFLALLELVKRREVVVEQAEPWGPIVARAATAEERTAGVAVVADDEPLDERLESFS